MRIIYWVGLGFLALLLGACSSQPKVSYADPNAVDTTSIQFSSTDLQTTTTKMVDGMLSSPQLAKLSTVGDQPVIFIGGIANETSEHINTGAILDAISTRLIQSNEFRFVDMAQVNKVREQFHFQQTGGLVDPNKAALVGKQIGARYMLYGKIASIDARNDDRQTLYFQVNMRLLDIQSGIVVWAGEKQIRKIAERSNFSW